MNRLLLLALALGATAPAFSQPVLSPGQLVAQSSLAQSNLAQTNLAQATSAQRTDKRPDNSPAQNLFDEVNGLLISQYGGLSQVDRAALGRQYQQRLNAVCGTDASCAADKAFPVISAEVTALGDEHTYFQNPDDFKDFVTSATGGNRLQFGVRLANLEGETRLVLEVVPGSASEDAGLKRGDVLRSIDGQPYSYAGLKAAKEGGRFIALGITRAGKPLSFSLKSRESSSRDLPHLSFVPAAAASGPVALLRIPTFLAGGDVAQTVHDEVHQAQAQNASGLIIDLRGNSGGDLSECDGAVSAFVPSFTRLANTAQGTRSTVVSGGSRIDDGRERQNVQHPALWTGPLTVMVDGGSASCSEFFAYELQFAKRATIIGEATAGVGNTATRIFPLDDGAALQLTILNYSKPGSLPYPVRINPDLPGRTDLAALAQGSDTLLTAAVSALPTSPVLSAVSENGSPSN